MNVFTTLKTVFFGSKVLSRPVPADGTPRRDLAIALNGLLPLCRAIPGMHLAVDIREGRAALVLDWTPRTDEKALSGAYHYESLPVRMGCIAHCMREGKVAHPEYPLTQKSPVPTALE